ncbi:MAG TPA: PrsW family glutamic-type intramembrane protease [Anaerolineaceae bacterium]
MATRPAIHWPSLAQFAFSGFVLLTALALAVGLALAGGLGWVRDPATADQSISELVIAAGVGLVALLTLPSVGLALARLLGRSLPGWVLHPFGRLPAAYSRRLILLGGVTVVWGLALAAGGWAAGQVGLGQLATAPLYVLIVGLPIVGYLIVGAGGLAGGSLQRRWGILSAGLVGTSLVVLIVEMIVFGLIILAIIVALAAHPDTLTAINRLAQRIANAQITPENLGRILRPYIQPWVIYLLVAAIAGLAPLIEEMLKPLPLWLFARRGITPAEGFVGGLLCGAGFALFESMGDLAAVSGESWVVSAVGRGGTDLLHMLNAGLMGWALALAWGQGRYLRLALTYLGVVALHGLWNTISITMGLLPLVAPPGDTWLRAPWVTSALVGGLIGLYVVMFGILLWANRRLSEPSASAVVDQDPAVEENSL